MTRFFRPLCLSVLLVSTGFGMAAAQGKVPLAEEPHINAQLVAGAAGDILRNTCASISARMFTVMAKLLELEQYARDNGYTEDEVRPFLKDKDQKARVKALAADYLAKAGAVPGDIESYCKVGRDEIAKATLLGTLLKSSE